MNLNPYVAFNGNCEEAMNFYKECLGGEITNVMRFGDSPMGNEENKNRIMHSRLEFGNKAILMASDSMDDKTIIGGNLTLSLDFDNKEELDTVFGKLSEGGHVTMPVGDQFWGARFGMCKDKFGTNWMLNSMLKK